MDDAQLKGEGEGDGDFCWRAPSDRAPFPCVGPTVRRACGADRRGCASVHRLRGVARAAAEAACLRAALIEGVRRALAVPRDLLGRGVAQRIPARQEITRRPCLSRPRSLWRTTIFRELRRRALS